MWLIGRFTLLFSIWQITMISQSAELKNSQYIMHSNRFSFSAIYSVHRLLFDFLSNWFSSWPESLVFLAENSVFAEPIQFISWIFKVLGLKFQFLGHSVSVSRQRLSLCFVDSVVEHLCCDSALHSVSSRAPPSVVWLSTTILSLWIQLSIWIFHIFSFRVNQILLCVFCRP